MISWVDVKSALGWTYNPQKKRTPGYLQSIGIFVEQNEECLTITSSMDERGASIDDLSIPLGCIKKVTILPDEFGLENKHV